MRQRDMPSKHIALTLALANQLDFSISAIKSSIALSRSPTLRGLPTHLWRITPLPSMIQRDGQPVTPHFDEIGPPVPPPFQNDRQVMCSLARTFFSSSRSWSLLTPIRANGLPSRRFTSDRSCSYMARQGPHQFPQKSSSTTFPR